MSREDDVKRARDFFMGEPWAFAPDAEASTRVLADLIAEERAEALEAAAKECEREARDCLSSGEPVDLPYAETAERCAARVRALRDKP